MLTACLKCKKTYNEGMSRCPKCGSVLVRETFPERNNIRNKSLASSNRKGCLIAIAVIAALYFLAAIINGESFECHGTSLTKSQIQSMEVEVQRRISHYPYSYKILEFDSPEKHKGKYVLTFKYEQYYYGEHSATITAGAIFDGGLDCEGISVIDKKEIVE